MEGVFREVGISNVKTIREKRYIPAILYRGRGFPDIPFCLKLRDIEKLSQDPGFMAMLFKLVIRPPRDDEVCSFRQSFCIVISFACAVNIDNAGLGFHTKRVDESRIAALRSRRAGHGAVRVPVASQLGSHQTSAR